jgi:hypothetical protein
MSGPWRTAEYHRAQVRRHLGFRECTAEDAGKLTVWLAAGACQAERQADRVREELLARCRTERIEPPSAGRCDRIVRSALHQAEQALALRVTARLSPDASARLAALAAAAGDDEAEDSEPSVLALIKSVPGNVSLECARPGCRTGCSPGWTYIGTGSHVKAGSGRSAGVSCRGWVGR